MSAGSIGETAARFLDEKNPWRVIPDVVALDQEGIHFATNKLDEREGACRCAGHTRWETGSGRVVQSIEPSISQHRGGADFEALRFGLLAWPGRLERTAALGRPPAASQRKSGDDRDLSAPGNLQRNVNSPVRVTPTEERRAVNRVDNPDPLGLTELTKFLAEERIFWRTSSPMVAIPPRRRLTRVSPLSYLSKTGMITTSLIASHISMRAAKSVTPRRMRSRWASTIESVGSSSSQGGARVCHPSG
jgi:hypothetical protein